MTQQPEQAPMRHRPKTGRRPAATATGAAILVLASLLATAITACSGDDRQAAPDAPQSPEEVAAFINDAVNDYPEQPGHETADVYARVAAEHLDDFARYPDLYEEPAEAEDGEITIGSITAARFVALTAGAYTGKDRVFDAFRDTAFEIAATGVDAEYNGENTDWERELGKLDGLIGVAIYVGSEPPDGSAMGDSTLLSLTLLALAHLTDALQAEAAGQASPGHSQVLDVAATVLSEDTLSTIRDITVVNTGAAAHSEGPVNAEARTAILALLDDTDTAAELSAFRRYFAGREELPVDDDRLDILLESSTHEDIVLGALLE